MADSNADKDPADTLIESLLNPDVEEQAVLDEELPQTLHVGEKQPSRFKDVTFAILFVIQLVVVSSVSISRGFPALKLGDIQFSGILYLSLISSLVAISIAALSLAIMTRYAHMLVQLSVLFSIFASLLMVIIFGISDKDGAAFVAFVFFLISACYAWAVWHRIPFAASNLVTALTAVRAYLGVTLVAYGMVVVAVLWSLIWMTALIGVYSQSADCSSGVCYGKVPGGTMVLFLLSFYWTHQVLKNLVVVVVAGVVGEWWFAPNEQAQVILDSLFRSVTFSLGSVCLGSLVVAAIQSCRTLVETGRRHSNDGIIMCILDCLLGCIERIVEYFNKFSYIYIGLYGYGYIEAGHKVMSLFAQRGWTTIINDDLVTNTLSLMSLVIGCITGCVGLAVAALHKSWVAEFPEQQSLSVPFLSSFLVGILIASILMSVVSSAVDTVMICFCESPNDLRMNYPHLSNQMVRAWRKTYPQEFVWTLSAEGGEGTYLYTAPSDHVEDVALVPPSSSVLATAAKTDPLAPPSSQT